MLNTLSVAGLRITAASKTEVLTEIAQRLSEKERTIIVTPYSEFLYAALKKPEVMATLNKADIAIPDGVGIQWAATFLEMPIRTRGQAGRFLRACWQVILSGARILLAPDIIKIRIPEKIVGADFFWELAELAHKRELSLYLLGGFHDTNHIVADKLANTFPGIRIAGTSNKQWHDPTLATDVAAASPDFLFVALGPIRQEQWIMDNIEALPSIKLAIGLGATFDYVAGTKKAPPKFIRAIGLEWLFRLITQPYRFKRIYNATFGLIGELVKYKLHPEEAQPETRLR
jgi:N-acetylglucosaminyldiphosphoundecaprenol N-acetyl-beta-D-mannosaminyltransferase